ncbi:hypothetical protein LDO51_00180 [Providencia alcalifaciens]|uniref:hypothetical protein n=1 Tax=Providencia alcalifaciens TaxID=126385 RepID=UPI001CE0CAE2|nr:hypothetical protein [Providencia alcalifaciens]UBX49288.1 hypothetical protein LDO51_00180 [Providencia alcalifaciens]
MKKLITSSLLASVVTVTSGAASAQEYVSIRYPDGRPDVVGIDKTNEILHTIGVHISTVDIPVAAIPLLKKSETEPLNDADKKTLISQFSMTREQLLDQIKLAGREPSVPDGGVMSRDVDGEIYPNINDMKSADAEARKFILDKYGRLHVNSSEDGVAIDEVMTVLSGGPFRWGFTLKDGTVIRFQVNTINIHDKAVRVSYSGMGMHAGIIDASNGLMLAYAHGPKEFVMRYKGDVPYANLLGTNPWIDYTGTMPKVLDSVKQ